jgi:hypothetical protein
MYPDPSINKQKNEEKTLISAVLSLLYNFLSSKNYVNVRVPSKRNMHKNVEKKNIFCSRLEGH